LRTQYRMHETIMGFSSRVFYDDRLQADDTVRRHTLADLGVNSEALPTNKHREMLDPDAPLVFVDTATIDAPEHQRDGSHSRENPREAEIVTRLATDLLRADVAPEQIAVISPYDDQVDRIDGQIGVDNLEVDTVDGFQGREKEIQRRRYARSAQGCGRGRRRHRGRGHRIRRIPPLRGNGGPTCPVLKFFSLVLNATSVRMSRFLLVLLLVGSGTVPAPAQPQSSYPSSSKSSSEPSSDADWLVVPYVSYSPTTEIALGGGVGYYTTPKPGHPPSQIEASLKVTQRRQISGEIEPDLYLNDGRIHLQAELRGSKFPSSFHGVGGDTPAKNEESFTSRYIGFDALLQWRVRPHLYGGPRVSARVGDITNAKGGSLITTDQVVGADGGITAGIGGAIRWDARDNQYFPTSGTYAEVVGTWYSSAWGSDYTFGHLATDLRGYRPTGPGVLAAQILAAGIAGQAPFLVLPTLGGADMMRGYRSGRFRDHVLWAVQTEYRFPLFWRLKGAAFTSAGEVAPRFEPTLLQNVEVAAGLGLRFRLTASGLHGRFDVGYSRTGIDIYLAVGEAF
ncbi:MAG: AAA domain-containing protein, partial [Salinibacter sp.]